MVSSIKKAEVLVVGAGGIGSELLKNLVLAGYVKIWLIDLDTIDLSNLNRQFLFRRRHIGQSKATVARDAVLKFRKNLCITAYHDNIMNPNYGVSFYKRFDCVVNALDNRKARSHVNRMCLASDVPLIETGTAGFFGQVEMILQNVTQCYDCEPKAAQKTFPGCTIRNTPSEPIHCVVWAKHLFNQLFGEEDAENEVSPDSADPEAKIESNDLDEGGKGDVCRISTRSWARETGYDPIQLYNKFFVDDINYLLSMKNLWTSRTRPEPLKCNWLCEEYLMPDENEYEGIAKVMKVWSISMCRRVFKESVVKLRERRRLLKEGEFFMWDKDDSDMLDFVTACATLRCYAFSIQRKSRFEIKAMAGNIIPAIAMTNAVIAGLAVHFVDSVLEGNSDSNCTIYLRREANHMGDRLTREKRLIPPNPKCYVCSSNPKLTIFLDTDKMRVKDFEEKILKNQLNMVQPDAYVGSSIIISSEPGETEHNEKKLLSGVNIIDGTIVSADDFFQEYQLQIIISHKQFDGDREFLIEGDVSDIKASDDSLPAAGPSGIVRKRKLCNAKSAVPTKICRTSVDFLDTLFNLTDSSSAEKENENDSVLAKKRRNSIDHLDTLFNLTDSSSGEKESEDDDDEDDDFDLMIVENEGNDGNKKKNENKECVESEDNLWKTPPRLYKSSIQRPRYNYEYYCGSNYKEELKIETENLSFDGCVIA